MKTKIILGTMGLLLHCVSYTQTLKAIIPTNIEGINSGEVQWIDINNDGHDELIITGQSANYADTTFIVNNTNDSLSLNNLINLTNLSSSSLTTADFNNDSYYDCIITGYSSSENVQKTIYLVNDGNGGFNENPTDISGITNGKVNHGDFNNDNLIDVIISGIDSNYNYIAELYFQNNSGNFSLQNTNLMANYFGDITIFDANTDGYIDILLTGFDNAYVPNTMLYINDGNGNFSELPHSGLKKMYFTGTSVSDYDGDNDNDILINGMDSTYTPRTYLYNNDGSGNFTIVNSTPFSDLFYGDADFIDINDDGEIDIFVTGQDSDGDVASNIYLNELGVYTLNTQLSDTIIDVIISTTSWSDYDNDGDIDLAISGMNNDGDTELFIYINELYFPSYVKIEEQNSQFSFNLYPNPTINEFYIELNTLEENSIVITNTIGQTVYNEKTATEKTLINTSNWKKGMYFVSINNQTKRIIIH
jgi:hypothetical protein